MDGDRKLFEAYRVRMINEWLNLPIYISSGFILGLTYISSGKMASSWISHMLLNSISCIEVMTIASNRHSIHPLIYGKKEIRIILFLAKADWLSS